MASGFGKKPADHSPPPPLREISEEAELAEKVGKGPAVIYKHSQRCGFCWRSQREMEKFACAHPDVPVLKIDVLKSRPLSDHVAERFGIPHQSPQAIAVREGEAVWHASHSSVTADRLTEVFE